MIIAINVLMNAAKSRIACSVMLALLVLAAGLPGDAKGPVAAKELENKPQLDFSSPIPEPVKDTLTPASALMADKPAEKAAVQGNSEGSYPKSVSNAEVGAVQNVSQSSTTNLPEPRLRGTDGMVSTVINRFDPRNIKPVSYSPVPAIVIFPVVKHGHEKAFSDLPEVFAKEFSQKLELKAPDTKIFHPIYTVDEIRMRGLGHIYDKVMNYYLRAGRPEPLALDYMLKQLTAGGQAIDRVIFVEADLDVNHSGEPSGLADRLSAALTDNIPRHAKFHVKSRVQVFNAEDPDYPMVWGNSWSKAVRADGFYNYTPSAYDDSDSHRELSKASRLMSRELMLIMPKEAYLNPEYDMSVQGRLLSGNDASSHAKGPSSSGLSTEDHQAIDRILRRQKKTD